MGLPLIKISLPISSVIFSREAGACIVLINLNVKDLKNKRSIERAL